MSEVLYRKWRPQRFEHVAGQGPVVQTLRNAVRNGTPSHAYLFCGPRGTGKTSTARIMAKAVNCAQPDDDGEPCDQCDSCAAYDQGRAIDLIELDAASNRGIDEVRDLRESAGYAPAGGRYKIYLVDEVHMLTGPAFNALLKTLEEPPPHVIFILATTEPHSVPDTILSRCQRFDLRRIPLDLMVQRLREIGGEEGFEIDDEGYEIIARHATGSLRDAVNLLDQLIAYHGSHLTADAVREGLGLVVDDRAAELARAAISRDLTSGLAILTRVRDNGVEVRQFLKEVVAVLRAMLLLKAGATEHIGLSDAQRAEFEQAASDVSTGDIVAALRALTDVNFSGDAYDALPAEIAFAALATGESAVAAAPAPATPQPPAAARSTPDGNRGQRGGGGAPSDRRGGGGRSTPAASEPAATDGGQGAGGRAPREAAAPREDGAAGHSDAASKPFAPPDAAEVTADLATLRERWDDVRAAARKANPKAGALLTTPSNAYPRSVQGDVVELGFQFKAHVDIAAGITADLARVIGEVLGREVRVQPVLWEELGNAGTATSAPRRGPGPMVEEAQKYGAELIDDPEDGAARA